MAKKEEKQEKTLIDREKLTKLMLEMEDFRQKHKLIPVEYELLLIKTLEIMKQCNTEVFAMSVETERRRLINESIKRQEKIEVKESEGTTASIT